MKAHFDQIFLHMRFELLSVVDFCGIIYSYASCWHFYISETEIKKHVAWVLLKHSLNTGAN